MRVRDARKTVGWLHDITARFWGKAASGPRFGRAVQVPDAFG
jgi:hypothetical protein